MLRFLLVPANLTTIIITSNQVFKLIQPYNINYKNSVGILKFNGNYIVET